MIEFHELFWRTGTGWDVTSQSGLFENLILIKGLRRRHWGVRCFISWSAPTGCRSPACSSAFGSFRGECGAVATSPHKGCAPLVGAVWSWRYGPVHRSTPTDPGPAPEGGAAGLPGPAWTAAVSLPHLPSGMWAVKWRHHPAQLMRTEPAETKQGSTSPLWDVLNGLKLKFKGL